MFTSDFTLLEGERIWRLTHPHPMAFARGYIGAVLLAIWGLAYVYFVSPISTLGGGILSGLGAWLQFLAWAAGVMLVGVLTAFSSLRRASKIVLTLFVVAIIGGAALVYFLPTISENIRNLAGSVGLSVYTFVLGLFSLLPVEIYRRSYKYYITNYRIVIVKRLFSSRERVIRYTNLEDLQTRRSFIGRIFGFGTIIPITASNIGTGYDEVMVNESPGLFTGDSLRSGVAGKVPKTTADGKKTIEVAMANPEEVLYEVPDPNGIKAAIDNFIQENLQNRRYF
jgi:membrane protein YdbS with pleckstrin-like domain